MYTNHDIAETQGENTDDIFLRTANEHLEVELTENEQDLTPRMSNPKSWNKRLRPIIFKFIRYNTRRKVFINKKRLKNTKFSITESLTNRRMEFLKNARNEFGINNVWTVDRRSCYYDEVTKKVRYILINCSGFLCYGTHKTESFF